jgi:cob(I)alamin adenosyltransferase
MKKGLLMIYTGNGMHRSAPTLGQAFRALGRGRRVCIIGFSPDHEKFASLINVCRHTGLLEVHAPLNGLTLRPGKAATEREGISKAFRFAEQKILSADYDLILLEGLLDLLDHGLMDENDVTHISAAKPEEMTVMISGSRAPASLLESADLVTEVSEGMEDAPLCAARE